MGVAARCDFWGRTQIIAERSRRKERRYDIFSSNVNLGIVVHGALCNAVSEIPLGQIFPYLLYFHNFLAVDSSEIGRVKYGPV